MVGQLMFKPFFQTLKFAAMFEHKHLKALKIKEIFTSLSYQTHNSYSVNDLKLLVIADKELLIPRGCGDCQHKLYYY